MHRRAFRLAAIAIALALPMAACDMATQTRSGSVSVLLTDAPGPDVVEAWVTITDIYLQGAFGEEDAPQGRFFLLQDGEETHELLSLQNNLAGLVSDVPVPAGEFGQLRVVISDGCVVTKDGSVFASSDALEDECGPRTGTLQMPSFAQTGAKVLLNGFQVTGGDQAIVLDFNVAQSFNPGVAGQSGMFVMNPVIHAAEISLTVGVTATLDAGEVELPGDMTLGDFSATLTTAEGDVSDVDFSEVNGVFQAQFRFLIPDTGPFEVALNAPDGWSAVVSPESPQEVSPASGQTVTIAWTLQSIEEIPDEED